MNLPLAMVPTMDLAEAILIDTAQINSYIRSYQLKHGCRLNKAMQPLVRLSTPVPE